MEKWQALEVQLNPDSPPTSLDVYVQPPRSCAEDIVGDLQDQPGGRLKFLLIGARGGGKSTELHRIAALLRGSYLIFSIDLDRSGLSALNVSAFDLLYLSGLVLLRGLGDAEGDDLYNALVQAYADNSPEEIKQLGDRKTALEGVAGFIEKAGDTLAVASLTAPIMGMVGPAAGIAAASIAAVSSRVASLGARLLGPRVGLVPESSPKGQALQQVCARIVRAVRGAHSEQPVCVIVDGLERMNGQAGARFREIFENTRLLANAPWSYVIAAPPCTMTQTYSVDGTLGYYTRVVWGFPPSEEDGPSSELVQLLETRLTHAGLDPSRDVISGGLSTITQQSGGLPRSAISILRRASKNLRRSRGATLTAKHISEACFAEAEALGRGLDEHRLKLLHDVHRKSLLPTDDETPTLFADGRILAHPPRQPGGLTVFQVHPLLITAVEEYRERMARAKSLRARGRHDPRASERRWSRGGLRARASEPATPGRTGHCRSPGRSHGGPIVASGALATEPRCHPGGPA